MTKLRLGLTLLCLTAPALGCLHTLGEVLADGGSGGSTGSGSTNGSASNSTTGAGSTTGGPAQVCRQLVAGLAGLNANFPGCNLGQYLGMAPSQTQCVAEIGICNASDLVNLQTFLACAGQIPPLSCINNPGALLTLTGELLPCLGSLQNVGNACQLALRGGATATTGGSGTGGMASTTTSGGNSGTTTGGTTGGSVAFCGACGSDAQCGGTNACVGDPRTGGTYCGADCSQQQLCPAGSQCAPTIDRAGNQVTQCRPSSCVSGIAECSACHGDRDCGRGNLCVEGGCALSCAEGQVCPTGSACERATTQGGRQTSVCVSSNCQTGNGPDGGGGADLAQACTDLVAADSYLVENFPGCRIKVTSPTQSFCEMAGTACSQSDLSTLDALALCIDAIPAADCLTHPLDALKVGGALQGCIMQTGAMSISNACSTSLNQPPDAG